jgi:hypothetical protein
VELIENEYSTQPFTSDLNIQKGEFALFKETKMESNQFNLKRIVGLKSHLRPSLVLALFA